MKKRITKYFAFCLLFVMFLLVGCVGNGGGTDDGKLTGKELKVYSAKLSSVKEVALLTGPSAVTDTKSEWSIGGTDLGFPYYDSVQNKMFFWFGDTFSSVNGGSDGWRSNVLGYTSDFEASDGISWEGFVHKYDNYAQQVISSRHITTGNDEYTCIPTGAICINGIHYCFYMSIKDWQNGWHTNFCNVAKSTDGGQTFTKLSNLVWVNETAVGQKNAVDILEISTDYVSKHIAPNFQQIFPYEYNGYVYLFGITEGRSGGCKLARVKTDKIEEIDSYEYYYGGSWFAGSVGLEKVKDAYDEASYIVMPSVAELAVAYNSYIDKFLMVYYTSNKIIYRTSSDLINWSDSETIVTNEEYAQLYGGMIHEKYMSADGKTVYFFLSKWYNYDEYDPTSYNVRVMSFTFK